MKRHNESNSGNTADSPVCAAVCGYAASYHAVREGNVPGEYVMLPQQHLMIRPGQMLL